MKIKTHQRVFVAMSGGVDSSVAALILKKQGYDVTGVFMRCYNLDGCAERDSEDARRVAGHLGIPFYVWDFEEEYKKSVVAYMVEGYRAGITPNPDVMCNREIKFGLFLKKALEVGADYIATGHYVKIKNAKSKISYTLFQANDKTKDQSYFLWTLTQDQLAHCLFPIGDYIKPEVRKIARKAGLPTAEKKDSQGICFLGKVTLADFLATYIPKRKGAVVNAVGEKVGEHNGAHFYTIGQRHGIGNMKHQKGNKIHAPLYVASKDVRANTVVVAVGEANPALYRKEINLTDVNIINPSHLSPTTHNLSVLARVRYRQPLSAATLHNLSPNTYKLVFNVPQKFVAPGQSAVFYMDDDLPKSHSTSRVSDPMGSRRSSRELRLLGGGIILDG